MAEAVRLPSQNVSRNCSAIHATSVTCTHMETVRRSLQRSANIATLTPGREQPSGPASGQDRPQNRGVAHAPAPSVTPAKWFRARHRTPRLLIYLSACKSSVWRDLREKPTRTPVHQPSVSTDDLAFPNCANHRSLSRLPSRRQPFPSRSPKTRVGRAPEIAPVCLRNAIRI